MNKQITIALSLSAVLLLIVIVAGSRKPRTYSLSETAINQETTSNMPESTTQPNSNQPPRQTAPPEMQIDQQKEYSAVLTTSEGKITIEFNTQQTPITVNNFVTLARSGFYDNTIFHRVIKRFMIQGGDPEGTGRGGPGYKFADEPFEGDYTRGVVAMANSGPNTNGSQFFIMHQDYELPKNYIIFGQVVEGLEVVDKIAEAPTQPGGEGSSPVTPVTVESIEIIEQ